MIIFLIILIFYIIFILTNTELFVNNVLFIGWQFLGIYVVAVILFLKKYRQKTLFNPEFLFSFVFLFCTFLYLPLLFSSNIDTFIFWELTKETNLNLIRSQSIAVMSFLFYLLGAVVANKRSTRETNKVIIHRNDAVLIKKRNVFHFITAAFITLSMFGGGYKIIYRYKENTVGLDEIGGLFQYITILLVISSALEFLYLRKILVSSLKNTFKYINRLYIVNLLFMISLFLYAGYRSALFPLLFPAIFLYDVYIKRINKMISITMLLGGIIFMSVMKDIRTDSNGTISENFFSFQYIGGDFASSNKALYFLINHVDEHGTEKGQNAIMQMVSFIPFAQSALISFFDIDQSVSSSKFFKEGVEAHWTGLGTHVIGDLYYSFGLFGTLFWMFLLGYIANILYVKSTKVGTIKVWEVTIYLLILGNSLMFPRVEFFFLVQNIGFSVIFIWLFQKFFNLNSAY